MRHLSGWIAGAAFLAAPLLWAQERPLGELTRADVAFLGEVHDNPAHHEVQAQFVADMQPRALVFEMLTPEQAGRITPELRGDPGALASALGWDAAGWPDFGMYYPIFAAAPDATVYGAGLPRSELRTLRGRSLVQAFGPGAARFGLDRDLPRDERAARMALQFEAHCEALPAETLPMMVDIQRLRDARIAQAVERAMNDSGGPVAVITGNGHARLDWGAPALLAMVGEARIFALGQGEGGVAPDGRFDLMRDAPPVQRPDPCDAFK